jgi:hypothetical protein
MLQTMVSDNRFGGYKSSLVCVMPIHIKHEWPERFSRIAPILTIRGYFFAPKKTRILFFSNLYQRDTSSVILDLFFKNSAILFWLTRSLYAKKLS